MAGLVVTAEAAAPGGLMVELRRLTSFGAVAEARATVREDMACPEGGAPLCTVFGGCDICPHLTRHIEGVEVEIGGHRLGPADAVAWARAHADEILNAA